MDYSYSSRVFSKPLEPVDYSKFNQVHGGSGDYESSASSGKVDYTCQ